MPMTKAELNEVLKASAGKIGFETYEAHSKIAKALEEPLRKGITSRDASEGIFEELPADGMSSYEYSLDFLPPGTENDYIAYTAPSHGYIPQRHVEGDYLMIPCIDIVDAIDTNRKYIRNANWDVVGRMREVLTDGMAKKSMDVAFQTLLAAGVGRNIVVTDSDAAQGQFTKRLVSLGKAVMARNGGGNSSSMNRFTLTDMYLSTEALEGIRNWNVDQVDEITRREIFVNEQEPGIQRVFGVNLHEIVEFGVGQQYQNYLVNDLSASLPASKVEFCLGLDLNANGAFIKPVSQQVEVFEDQELHRQRRWGLYSEMSAGWGVADNRAVLLFAL